MISSLLLERLAAVNETKDLPIGRSGKKTLDNADDMTGNQEINANKGGGGAWRVGRRGGFFLTLKIRKQNWSPHLDSDRFDGILSLIPITMVP